MKRSSGKVRLRAVVRGFVQGVGYRLKTRELAVQLGLTGMVRNAGSGVVEVVAEGPREKLEILLGWLYIGPPVSHVDAIKASWGAPKGGFRGFGIASGRTGS